MNGSHIPVHEYRVRFSHPSGPSDSPAELRTTVDVAAQRITVDLPGQATMTVDVVTARALSMLLWNAVFGSLHPAGPQLSIEKNTGHGWGPAAGPEKSR